MRSPQLSATAPTNMPCVSVEILLAGIRLSICVLMEVDLSLAVDGDALAPLQNFAETLPKASWRLAHHLTGEDVAHRVHHYGGFLVAVIALELREVLKAEADRHLVAAGGGDKIVQTLK